MPTDNCSEENAAEISMEFFFPTLIYSVEFKDPKKLNDYLEEKIELERAVDNFGQSKSNIEALGGWHSQSNLHHRTEFLPIVSRISWAASCLAKSLGCSEKYEFKIASMWSIVNPPGSSNISHVHPSSDWSGVYYVQTPKDCGDIEFTDPITPRVMAPLQFMHDVRKPREAWSKVRYTPRSGRLLIFPSWLYHSVQPNLSKLVGRKSNRIILSFNLKQEAS